MSLPSTLQKLRMYREWIQYSRDQEYEDYDDRWEEFLDEWRMEKALNRLAESFSAEDFMAEDQFDYQLCQCDMPRPRHAGVHPTVCQSCNMIIEDEFNAESFDADAGDNCPYCYCEHENLSLDREPPYFDGEVAWVDIQCDDCGMKANAATYEFEFEKQGALEDVGLPIAVNMENPNYGIVRCPRCHERFEKSAESFEAESFKDWADDELRTHGENVSFDKWVQEEYEDEPSHRHPNGQLSFIRWSRDEMNEKHHAEQFCSDCGSDTFDITGDKVMQNSCCGEILGNVTICVDCGAMGPMENCDCSGGIISQRACFLCGELYEQNAESFSAETEDGNQVFNSCWKCGSGQHLYQISRYPASPDEIAGIGMDPETALEGWESKRPPQTS